jgi:outer membrane lipoprotein-sorting protein
MARQSRRAILVSEGIAMRKAAIATVACLAASACSLPFGIGQASTSQLLNGATDSLAKSSTFEVVGGFTSGSNKLQIDLQFKAPSTVHLNLTTNGTKVEVIQLDGTSYYRGKDYVPSVVGTDAQGQELTTYIGDTRWVTSKSATPIDMSGFTDANKVKASFLNTIGVQRKDNVTFNGQDTAELTGSGYILNITESSPYHLVRLRTHGKGSSDFSDADITFENYNKTFDISVPSPIFNLDDPSTWPPLYTVTAINLDGCNADPCVVVATVQNGGGTKGAPAPSTVTFTATNQADNSDLGTCKATITPDVANAAKASVSCSITGGAWTAFAQIGGSYLVKAVPDNPAYD